jgi:hypothetical protein
MSWQSCYGSRLTTSSGGRGQTLVKSSQGRLRLFYPPWPGRRNRCDRSTAFARPREVSVGLGRPARREPATDGTAETNDWVALCTVIGQSSFGRQVPAILREHSVCGMRLNDTLLRLSSDHEFFEAGGHTFGDGQEAHPAARRSGGCYQYICREHRYQYDSSRTR